MIADGMDESKGVSDDQQTDLVANLVLDSPCERSQRRMELRLGYLGT